MSGLRVCQWKYPNNRGAGCTVMPTTNEKDLQQYFLQLTNRLKNFDIMINCELSDLLHGNLKEKLKKLQKEQLSLLHRYVDRINPRLMSLSNPPPNLIKDRMQLELNKIIKELTENLEDLRRKGQFIDQLYRQNIGYINASEYIKDKNDTPQIIERRIIKSNHHSRILCSNDTLNRNNSSKLNELLHQLTEERKRNPNLRLIYADYSDCLFELYDMNILTSSSQSIPRERITSFRSYQDDVINILLLGETGVGKSTFINAFVNYLTHKTLQQAETNPPVVMMPVSFLLTTGHNFTEHTVKFGDFNAFSTEDFNHPGESVTQHCNSYVINLKQSIGKKICIIDTPGFGDTRGLDQDDLNMQHVLKYINNLPHINAICFLLKPNATRLHIFFRNCLTQLLDLLGPQVRQNLIFCFTNARSTFYTPGDTAPVLTSLLKSLSMTDIPFKKDNTFCFDNEAFRYLVARQNGIEFSNEEKVDYDKSWTTSVKESYRLLEYIHTKLQVYPIEKTGFQSIKHAQIEIIQMLRPILETMRNLLRNLILRKTGTTNKSIELCPKPIPRPTHFCTSCKRDPFLLVNFWMLPDHPHEIQQNQCQHCTCQLNQHLPIDYLLSYDTSTNSQLENINDILDQLCSSSAEFAYFLMNIVHSTKNDVFLIGLNGMIDEERQICAAAPDANHLNSQLVIELEKLKEKYEGEFKKIKSNKQQDLKKIYKSIGIIHNIPMIHNQIAAIKKKEDKRMKTNASEL